MLGLKKWLKKEKLNENDYLIGLDLGRDSSHLAYINPATKTPEVLDVSGGYGKTSVPTMIQFLPDSEEWVFGEYAALNQGMGPAFTIDDLISPLGKSSYISIGTHTYSIASLLSLFIKDLILYIKNINPKATLKGVVAAIPTNASYKIQEELEKAFLLSGVKENWLGFVSDREALFNFLFYQDDAHRQFEHLLVLDYGASAIRGNLYKNNLQSGEIICLSTFFQEDLGAIHVDEAIFALIKSKYKAHKHIDTLSDMEEKQLTSFSFQHKDMLFQSLTNNRAAKLYFNFTYPAFQVEITSKELTDIIAPVKESTRTFVLQLLQNSILPLSVEDIDTLFLTGGGFEMQWAKKNILDMFLHATFISSVHTKASIAKGAAVESAKRLGFIKQHPYTIVDVHQLTYDIGITLENNFFPVVEKNTYWWQEHKPISFLINEPTNNLIHIPLLMKENDILKKIDDLPITGLPDRPKGTTIVTLDINFPKYDTIIATVEDRGFGELFPVIDYKQSYEIKL